MTLRFPASLLFVPIAFSVAAQETTTPVVEDSALTALRNGYQASLKSNQEMITKKQLEALRALEKSRAERGDYLGAKSAQDWIRHLEQSTGISASLLTPVLLDTKSHTEATYGASVQENSFHLAKVHGAIKWEGMNVKPGTYTVRMTYSVGDIETLGTPENPKKVYDDMGNLKPLPTFGGTIVFQEETSINASEPVKKRVYPTSVYLAMTTQDVGTIRIGSSRTKLSLKITEAEARGAMLLKQILLVPKDMADIQAQEPKELTALRTEFQTAVAEKILPAHMHWLTKLQDWEVEAKSSNNSVLLERVVPEREKLKSMLGESIGGRPGTQAAVVMNAGNPLMTSYKGEIRLSSTKDRLERLRPIGARVSFKLAAAKVKPGTYSVTINAGFSSGMGGRFRVSCMGKAVAGTMKAIPGVARQSIALSSPITISEDALYLDLEVTSLNSENSSLCELYSITLSPLNR